jgi:hypothetical protein
MIFQTKIQNAIDGVPSRMFQFWTTVAGWITCAHLPSARASRALARCQ